MKRIISLALCFALAFIQSRPYLRRHLRNRRDRYATLMPRYRGRERINQTIKLLADIDYEGDCGIRIKGYL